MSESTLTAGARATTPRTDLLLLINAIMGQFLSGFATRIFIVALPTVASALHADIIGISWALIAYQLAGISLSVVFGRLGDLHGRYVIYGGGFAIMAVTSLLCGFAPNVEMLIVFRFVQGIGAAMLSSATRVLAMEAMPEGSEGRANGFMTMGFHGGLMIGPPVGGLIVDLVSWRWVFFLLVPLSMIGVVLTVMRAAGRRPPRRTRAMSIDYVGAAILVALTIMLTLLVDRRSAELIGVGQRGVMALIFAVTVLAFVVHERRVAEPIVNFALFRLRMFTFSALSLGLIATATSVLGFVMPFYIQDVLHLSPSFMGLIFLAAPIFTIALAAPSGRLTDRIGPRLPTTIGVLMNMAVFGVGILLRQDSSWVLTVVIMGLMGLGSGFFNTANQTAIIASVPKEYRGFATGMVQTMFGIGSLIGISLGGVLLTVMFRYYSGLPDARPDPANAAAFVSAMNATYAVCLALLGVALVASVMRGSSRIAAPGSLSVR